MKEIMEQRKALTEDFEQRKETMTAEELTQLKGKLETLETEERKLKDIEELAGKLNNGEKKGRSIVKEETRSFGEFVVKAYEKRNDPQNDMTADAKGKIIVPVKHVKEVTHFEGSEFALAELTTKVEKEAGHPQQKVVLPIVDQDENTFGGVAMTEYDDSGNAINLSEVKFDSITVEDQMVAARVVVSKKLLENSRYGDVIAELFRKARAGYLERRIVKGTRGYKNADATITVSRAEDGVISFADIAKMYSAFSGENPRWIVGRQHLAQLLTMTDANGRLIFSANGQVVDRRPGTLLGIPVIVSPYEETLSLVDLSYMYLSTTEDLELEFSAHEKFSNAQVVVRGIYYVDNAPKIKNKILLEDEETYVSPFVTLSEEAEEENGEA
jgi:HK97 family phage major capsid protein